MNKIGQYYTFAGLLFMIFVFVIVDSESKVRTVPIDDVNYYLDNYLYESKHVINNAVYEKSNVSVALNEYTEEFIDYLENKNSDIEILYLYSQGGRIHVVNYLSQAVTILSTGESVGQEEEKTINYIDEITVTYDGASYDFEFNYPEQYEIKTLFVKNENE